MFVVMTAPEAEPRSVGAACVGSRSAIAGGHEGAESPFMPLLRRSIRDVWL